MIDNQIALSNTGGNHQASSKGPAMGWLVMVDEERGTLAYYANEEDCNMTDLASCCFSKDPSPCCFYEPLFPRKRMSEV